MKKKSNVTPMEWSYKLFIGVSVLFIITWIPKDIVFFIIYLFIVGWGGWVVVVRKAE